MALGPKKNLIAHFAWVSGSHSFAETLLPQLSAPVGGGFSASVFPFLAESAATFATSSSVTGAFRPHLLRRGFWPEAGSPWPEAGCPWRLFLLLALYVSRLFPRKILLLSSFASASPFLFWNRRPFSRSGKARPPHALLRRLPLADSSENFFSSSGGVLPPFPAAEAGQLFCCRFLRLGSSFIRNGVTAAA